MTPDPDSLPERGSEPPISYTDLHGLFEWLNRPNPPPCDHTHRLTREFLEKNQLPIEETLRWLCAHAGFCDCEVIFNVTNDWGEKVGFDPPNEDDIEPLEEDEDLGFDEDED